MSTGASAGGITSRLHSTFKWRNVKGLSVGIPAAALLISMFELKPTLLLWLREVATNLVLCLVITLAALFFAALVGPERIRHPVLRLAAMILACTLAGLVGGLVAWGINALVFSFHVSPGRALRAGAASEMMSGPESSTASGTIG